MNHPSPDIHELRSFLVLAEELHFARAAKRLGTSQPSLSRLIGNLEKKAGVQLFERSTRHVALTSAGQLFFEKTRLGLAQIDQAVQFTRLVNGSDLGQFSIGFSFTALFNVLPKVLKKFQAIYPRVSLQLYALHAPIQVKYLVEGQLDIGLLRPPIVAHSLAVEPILTERLVVAMPSNHRFAGLDAISLASLADEPFIGFSSTMRMAPTVQVSFQDDIVRHCNHAGFSPRVVHEGNDIFSVLALVAAGFGVTIVPEWTKRIQLENVVFRPIPDVPPIIELAMAWMAQSKDQPLKDFVRICKEQIASERAGQPAV